jgi:Tfp pilus assembly protein PilF
MKSMDRVAVEEAEAGLRRLLRDEPANVLAIHDLAILAYRDGRSKEALHLLRQTALLEPGNVAVLKSYAQVLRKTGEPGKAAEVFQLALDAEPRDAAVWNAVGVCLQESGKPAQAMEAYLRALALEPQSAEVLNNMGIVLLHEKDIDGAIDSFEQALALKEDYADAHSNLAVAYRDRLDYGTATREFRLAYALKPESAEIAGGLGEILSLVYEPEAESLLRRAVELAPESAERHWNLAVDLLRRGAYAEGWREHEWRWKRGHGHNTPREFTEPYWLGDADVRDKTVLIHAEQGFGDTLHMLRYVAMVRERGARVVLEVQPELRRLVADYFAHVDGEVVVVARGETLPKFDTHLATMSLPLAFGTLLESAPGPIQLARSVRRRERGEMLRMGVAWAGNVFHPRDRERSLQLGLLRPLFEIAGVEWVSLQTGAATKQIAEIGVAMEQPVLRDFADTAAVMEGLDVVISVDSAVAHLAGSHGVATWILLPFVADWRWLRPEVVVNPWYPEARIFRQRDFPMEADQRVRWGAVVAEVGMALRGIVGG